MIALIGHAVTDGPGGNALVVIPQETDEARRLRKAHSGGFWCSRRGGGCGRRLDLVAGDSRAKYFRHRPGEAHFCDLADKPEALERSLLHLLLQTILSEWVASQGLDSTIEATLHDAGRADLRVDVHDVAHTIEVQISSIPVPQWQQRDERYQGRVETVTWLFGERISQPLLTEVLASRGIAFKVARDQNVPLAQVARPEHILVGTKSHSQEEWHPLPECKMTRSGLWTPASDDALAEHIRWLRTQSSAPAERPKSGGGGSGDRTQKPQLEGQTATERPRPGTDSELRRPRAASGAQPRHSSAALAQKARGRNPLASFDWFLHFDAWESPPGLLDGLPDELHHAARVLGYMTTCIETTGAQSGLAFPDVEDKHQLMQALRNAGLIELYVGPAGVRRWRRSQWAVPRAVSVGQ